MVFTIDIIARANLMKIRFLQLTVLLLCFATGSAFAQRGGPGFGGPPRGTDLSGPMAKLFGNYPGFSATMEIQTGMPGSDEKMNLPAKISFLEGKSRCEMDMTQARGGRMPTNVITQMKSMGMDQMIAITRPDKKVQYTILPSFKAYAELPLTDPEAAKSKDDFKMEVTQISRETVDGHDCIQNKVVITDNDGNRHDLMVWNATDLDKFPVKIERTENNALTTFLFKEIKLTKPDASLFEPPADFTKYNTYGEMIKTEMMKKYQAEGAPKPVQPKQP
jgi:Domain of unknown function (DUF4412)